VRRSPTKRRSLALGIALVVPLVAIPTLAAVVLTGDAGGTRIPLARGTTGGTFHPVAGAFKPDGTKLSECDGEFSCLEQAFANIAYRQGPKAALTLFDRRIAEDKDVAADCHPISHWIGSAALARNRGNVAKTFVQGSASCASGYYHGILERAFAGVSSKARLAKLARSICMGQGLRRFGYFDRQCKHGLGHGLMIQTGYDLPTALAICGGLGTRWDHLTCSNGVFMENANRRFGFRSRWLDDDDPLYPCYQVASLDRRHCFARVATQVLWSNPNDFEKVAATCASLARRWERHCFRGMGRDAVDLRTIPGNLYARCRLAGEWEGECLFGAARWVTDRAGSEGIRSATGLCDAAPRTGQSGCFRGIGGVLGLLNPSNASRRSACAAVTARYVEPCTSAAIAEVDPSAPEVAWG